MYEAASLLVGHSKGNEPHKHVITQKFLEIGRPEHIILVDLVIFTAKDSHATAREPPLDGTAVFHSS